MKRIFGGIFFLVGGWLMAATIFLDFFKLALHGNTEGTALALCIRAAHQIGFYYSDLMGTALWLMPVFFTGMGWHLLVIRRRG